VRLLAWLIKANGFFISLAFGLIELLLKAIAVTKRISKKHEGTQSIAEIHKENSATYLFSFKRALDGKRGLKCQVLFIF